jgi:hypothetical protein
VDLILKCGLLTCGFYVVMTLVLEVALWPGNGWMIFIDRKHPALGLGIFTGVILGFLWLVAFSAAWYIVARNLRSLLPPN